MIYLVSKFYKPDIGGIESFFAELSKFLISNGYSTEIITGNYSSRNHCFLERVSNDEGIIIRRYDRSKKSNIIINTIREFCSFSSVLIGVKSKQDIFIVRNSVLTIWLRLLKPRASIIYIPPEVQYDTFSIENKLQLNSGMKKSLTLSYIFVCEKMAFQFASTVFTFNKFLKNTIIERYKVRKEKIIVTPPGCSSQFYDSNYNHQNMSDKLNSAIPRYALFIGRLEKIKGVDLLLEVWKGVNVSNKLLLIAGTGSLDLWMRKRAKELNLNKSVKFLGAVDNPYILIRDSELVINTSRYEAFGHTVKEACLSGSPTVAFNGNGNLSRNGLSEFDGDGLLTTMLNCNTLPEMSEKISEILKDPKSNTWRRSISEKALPKYDHMNILKAIRAIYEN
jgi:glycosyltransferase involved in cell wall biosynthesis